ncbi:MAG: hypothetical protein P8L77_01410 [Gammaproteobacteria bacterium]|nr:hypothetical protein [Gammaproteobacteria bacterium]
MLEIVLPEHLNFDEISDYLETTYKRVDSATSVQLNFRDVKRINSILVAFLICVINQVERKKIKLKMLGVTEELFSYLGDSQLEEKIKSFCS